MTQMSFSTEPIDVKWFHDRKIRVGHLELYFVGTFSIKRDRTTEWLDFPDMGMSIALDPSKHQVSLNVDELHGMPTEAFVHGDMPSTAAGFVELFAQTIERAYGRQEARKYTQAKEAQERLEEEAAEAVELAAEQHAASQPEEV